MSKSKQFKEGKDYHILSPKEGDNLWICEVATGKYKGICIRFDTLSFNDEEESIGFNFSIMTPKVVTEKDEFNVDNEEIQQVAANILNDVIDKALDEGYTKPKETGKEIGNSENDNKEYTN